MNLLSRLTLLFLFVGIIAMEQRPAKKRKISYENNNIPQNYFDQIPDEVALQILLKLASKKPSSEPTDENSPSFLQDALSEYANVKFNPNACKQLNHLNIDISLEEAVSLVSKMQLVSKRFYALVNDKNFVKNMINYWSNRYNISSIHVAILWNSPRAQNFLETALQDKSNITIFDRYIRTNPLDYAASLGRIRIIKMLLEKIKSLGIDMSELWNCLPVFTYAIQYNRNQTVKFLFDTIFTPAHTQVDSLNFLIPIAVKYDNIDATTFFIKQEGVKLNKSALYNAVGLENYEMVKLLINNGAIVTKEALELAKEKMDIRSIANTEIFNLLRENYKSKDNET